MSRPLLTPDLIGALARAVPRRAQMVWVYLWSRADRQTAKAWPSTGTIAEAVGTHRNRVSEDIQALAQAGWLRIERRAGISSRYGVAVPTSAGCNQNGITTPGDAPAIGAGGAPVTGAGGALVTGALTHQEPTKEPATLHGAAASDSMTLEDLVVRWSAIEGVRHCRTVTPKRRQAWRTRSKEPHWLDDVPAALDRVAKSDFCKGGGERGWVADVDWLLRPDTVTKLLEGKYDNTNGNPPKAERFTGGASERVFT